MRSMLKVLVTGAALLALLALPAAAAAATYTVTRTDDPVPGPCEPADCSLREALTAANGTTAVDDDVVLPASAAPYLVQYEFLTLPINDDVEIRGAGAAETVVEGDGKEIVFTIPTAGVKTTLVGLTITGGKGAIQNSSGPLRIRRVSIEGNEREDIAGGITTNGPLTIESSFLGFNRTNAGTGGALHSNADVTIVNSTIAHNSSENGPAAIGVNALLTISSSAVVSNRSEAMTSAGAAAIELTVQDSIFADNRNATALRNCSSGTPISLGGNVSDDATCGTGPTDKPDVDPGLGTLALHGGTTPLYDLLAGSPAVDAAGQCPPFDQRGVERPQGAACDSGPYEIVVVPPPAPPAPVGDRELAMQLAKGRLFLNRKGRVRVRLTCPPSEASPPCVGKVELRSPMLRTLIGGIRDSRPTPHYPTARFKIRAGETKALIVRPARSVVELLRESSRPRKVRVIVRAADGAGNSQLLNQRRKLVVLASR
jgi:hypothetical protein